MVLSVTDRTTLLNSLCYSVSVNLRYRLTGNFEAILELKNIYVNSSSQLFLYYCIYLCVTSFVCEADLDFT
jgi:hypothetical protein